MTRSRFLAPRVFLTAAAIAALFLLLVPSLPAAIERTIGSHPTVTDGRKTLNNQNVTGPVLDNLSGLRDNIIRIQVEGTNNEVLVCENANTVTTTESRARMHYTFDGSRPTTSSPRVPMECPNDPTPAASMHNYQATLPVATLATAPPGATVSFIFVITPATGGTSTQIPAATEPAFKYRLDKTAPVITNRVPAIAPGSSLDTAVARNERVALSFVVGDDHREAAIDPTSINITIPSITVPSGTSTTTTTPVYTKHFNCAALTQFNVTCSLDYAKLSSTFTFPEGNYTMTVKAQDLAKNDIATGKADLKFRIDLRPPGVTNVAAAPQSVALPAPAGGLPTTGRGTNITVTADVSDISMNTKGTTREVRAQLFNTTMNLRSEFVPMKFVSGTKWETKELKVPNTWPEGIYAVSALVQAQDEAGNEGNNATGTTTNNKFTVRDAFILDASPPKIVEDPVPLYVKQAPHTVRVNITDQGTGLDDTKVKIRYINLVGEWVTPPTGTTKVGQYYEATMTKGQGSEFTYQLPAANDGAILVYFVLATDKAGVTASTDSHTLRVDGVAPIIKEVDPKAFRGSFSNVFRVELNEGAGSGVNLSTAKLFYNFGGSTFRTANLVNEANSSIYRAEANFTGATDGATLRYFFEATDNVGNMGNLSSAANPLTSRVDLKPPVSTFSAPATHSGEKIPLTWNATDVGAGVDTFTLHARVQGNTEWVLVLEDTRSRTMEFCAEGNRTYEFRVFAKDRGGNVETPPAEPMGSTQLIGAGCKEILTVRVLTPTIGQRIDGRTSSTPIQYSAVTTSSATPSRSLKIAILFSPDDGVHYYTMAASQNNSGVYSLSLQNLPSCRVCLIKVQATSLSGIQSFGTSVPFEILNGNAQTDLDGNGLPDSWELRYGRSLGFFTASGDPDGDGLSNTQESQVGTSPNAKDTDGDGASDRAEVRSGFNPLSPQSVPGREFTREDEYTNWYWVVPGLFMGTAIMFFAGLARRW